MYHILRSKNWFFIRFSIFHIFHVNVTTFEKKYLFNHLVHPKTDFLSSQDMHYVRLRIFDFMSFFFERLLVFELWSTLYFTFVMHSGLTRIHKYFMLGGLGPLKPSVFVGVFAPRVFPWERSADDFLAYVSDDFKRKKRNVSKIF